MHFTMDIKAIGRKLVEAERMIQDWKSSFKILLGDKLVEDGKRNRWMRRESACYSYVHFCNSDHIMRKTQSWNIHDVITESWPSC